MAKLNIFISQPMHGLSEREILAERDRIEEVLHKLFPDDELTFLSGYTSDAAHFKDENQERIYRLGCSISIMSEADYIFLPYEYNEYRRRAKGCEIEEHVAANYDMPIIHEVVKFDQHKDQEYYTYSIANFGGNRM